MIKNVFAMIFVMFFMAGCASLTSGGSEQAAAKTTIQFATLKVIDEDQDRADKVVKIVSEVEGLVGDSGQTRLGVVEKAVRAEIDWSKLDNAEKLVVNNLIDSVRVEIEQRIDEGVIDPEDEVAVKNVLKWIKQAAQMAGGSVN